MASSPETQKMCRIDDPITNIGYKIIYRTSKERYEIWTQYKDQNNRLRRNRVTYDEAIRREHDLKSLTDYVIDYLAGKHIRYYDNEVQEKSVIKNRKNIEKKSVSKKSATKLSAIKRSPKKSEETFAYSADLKVKKLVLR